MKILGVDIGSARTKLCWRTGKNKVETNVLPTCLYFDEKGVLIGEKAREKFEHASQGDEKAKNEAFACYFGDFYADLSINSPHAISDGRMFTDQELTTLFFKEIRSQVGDFEALALAHDPDASEITKSRVIEAANQAGFSDVLLVEAPMAAVAGAINAKSTVKAPILMLDAGASRFSMHTLVSTAKNTLRIAPFAENSPLCGRKFDEKLYEMAEKRLQIPFSDEIDPVLLRACRECREKLSTVETALIFNQRITRAELESLLENDLLSAIEAVQSMQKRLADDKTPPKTVILTGGIAQMPLFQQKIAEGATKSTVFSQNPVFLSAEGAVLTMERHNADQKTTGAIQELTGVTVTIESDPTGAEIILDGKNIGKTPVSVPIDQGKHTYTAKLFGYHDENGSFESNKWDNVDFPVKMRPFIGLYIDSEPKRADVYINEKKLTGRTPLRIQIEAGNYYVEVESKKMGYSREGKRIKYVGDKMGVVKFELIFDQALKDQIIAEREEKKRKEVERLAEEARRKEEERIAAEIRRKEKKQQAEVKRIKREKEEEERARIRAEQAMQKEIDDLIKDADQSLKNGDYPVAVKKLETALKQRNDPRALYRLGQCYWNGWLPNNRSNAKKAIEMFRNSAEAGSRDGIVAMARIAFIQRRYKIAIELWERVVNNHHDAKRDLNTCKHFGWGMKKKNSDIGVWWEDELMKKLFSRRELGRVSQSIASCVGFVSALLSGGLATELIRTKNDVDFAIIFVLSIGAGFVISGMIMLGICKLIKTSILVLSGKWNINKNELRGMFKSKLAEISNDII